MVGGIIPLYLACQTETGWQCFAQFAEPDDGGDRACADGTVFRYSGACAIVGQHSGLGGLQPLSGIAVSRRVVGNYACIIYIDQTLCVFFNCA